MADSRRNPQATAGFSTRAGSIAPVPVQVTAVVERLRPLMLLRPLPIPATGNLAESASLGRRGRAPSEERRGGGWGPTPAFPADQEEEEEGRNEGNEKNPNRKRRKRRRERGLKEAAGGAGRGGKT